MKINGTVTIDLTKIPGDDYDSSRRRDRAVQEATWAPAGADVVFVIERRTIPAFEGLEWLRQHGQHLGSVTFSCSDPDTIHRWVSRLRGEAIV